ncbi:MAG TPA: hypothetical protein VJ623_13560 [Holophagaceae bacterium]|nr:hypothetical protein [Holophagaceae bacterium]
MRLKPWQVTPVLLAPVLLAAQEAPAPPTAEQVKALEERLRKLEEELRAQRSAPPEATPEPARLGGAGGAATKALNPDISLIGNFLGSVGNNEVNPEPALDMHEAELGLQAVVDPYSRGDVFLAFGKEGVSVEEAFLSFNALPGGFLAKVGKMRAAFGKVNPSHTHSLHWTDRPLVTGNLVGGEDGINDMGISVSHVLPAPGDFYLEATAQVFKGDSEGIYASHQKKDLIQVGHLKGYQDLTENTNLEVGYSYSRGHNELGSDFLTTLQGVDLTLRWKPLARSIYTSFQWRTEFIWSRRDQLAGAQRSKGMYSDLEYRMNQRWTFGARFDRSARAEDATKVDRGFSGLATYWMSEFSQLRGQYRVTRYDGARDAHEFKLQLLFVMGAHGAHPF